MNTLSPPRYPDAERARGEEAGFLVAFVLDTTGHVEVPSISFIGKAPNAFAQYGFAETRNPDPAAAILATWGKTKAADENI